MWSTISSMRESAERRLSTVRENAIAAAQVAQDVLTAAATEDDAVTVSSSRNEDSDWQNWAAQNEQPYSPPPPETPTHPPVPLRSGPPPPPSDNNGAPFSRLPPKRPARASRYVVTELETSETPKVSFRTPPRPSFNMSSTIPDSAIPHTAPMPGTLHIPYVDSSPSISRQSSAPSAPSEPSAPLRQFTLSESLPSPPVLTSKQASPSISPELSAVPEQNPLPETLISQELASSAEQTNQSVPTVHSVQPVPPMLPAPDISVVPLTKQSGMDVHHVFHSRGNADIPQDALDEHPMPFGHDGLTSGKDSVGNTSYPDDVHSFIGHSVEERMHCNSMNALQNSNNQAPALDWGGFEDVPLNIQQDRRADFGFPSGGWPEDRVADDGSSFFGVDELQNDQTTDASKTEAVREPNVKNNENSAESNFVTQHRPEHPFSDRSAEFPPAKRVEFKTALETDEKKRVLSNQDSISFIHQIGPVDISSDTDKENCAHETQAEFFFESNRASDEIVPPKDFSPLHSLPPSNDVLVAEQHREIKLLKKDLQAVHVEKNSVIAEKEQSEHNYEAVRREVMVLRDEVADCKDDMHLALAERDEARESMKQIQAEMLELIQERDNALANSKKLSDDFLALPRSSTFEEQEKLTNELSSLRAQQQDVEDERDASRRELEILASRHDIDMESVESRLKEKEVKLNIAVDKNLALEKERDDAMTARFDLIQEQRNLFDDVQARAAEVHEKETELNEIRKMLRNSAAEKLQEKTQLEAVAEQLSELRDAMESAVSERNNLYIERQNLGEELDKLRSELSSATININEVNRKLATAAKDAQDSESKSKTMQTELDEIRGKCEAIRNERDNLVHQRALSLDVANIPQSMKDLGDECESKTREIAGLHHQLKSASAKVSKLTAQRIKILRQRDDAGARLNAAGVEFSEMSNKLKRFAALNTEASSQVCKLREERDDAHLKISELAANALKVDALEKAAVTNRKELLRVEEELAVADKSRLKAKEKCEILQNELQLAKTEVKRISDVLTVTVREMDATKQECETLKVSQSVMEGTLQEEKETALQARQAFTQMQVEMNSTVERIEDEKKSVMVELLKEKASIASTAAKLEAVCASLQRKDEALSQVRNELEASLRHGENAFKGLSVSEGLDLELSSIHDSELMTECSSESEPVVAQAFGKAHKNLCHILAEVVDKLNIIYSDSQEMRINSAEDSKKLQSLDERISSLNRHLVIAKEECVRLQSSENSMRQIVEADKDMISELQSEKIALIQNLKSSTSETNKLQDELEEMGMALAAERSNHDALSLDEKKQLEDQITMATTQIDSLWAMSQQSLRPEVIQNIIQEGERNGEDDSMSSIGIMVMQGFRTLTEELKHLRSLSSEYDEKLIAAQREIDLIFERTEIAESERDSARAARDRWEREAKSAKDKAFAEATAQADLHLVRLRQELDNAREDISILQDSLEKSETENANLRSSCDKLTAKVNLTSQQLDDSEERLAYLQDEVATLKEDLEYAQEKAQSGEQETGEVHRVEIDRLSSELDASREHAAGLEEQVMMLRDEAEKSQNAQVEMRLIMETHQTAEQNLQIAIEQLEAEQESLIERKTMELQHRLDEAVATANASKKKMDEVIVVENQLVLRDEEISDLRTALGRLSDERVELKLELEKSLSRLNHPGGGEQLVDRRYIRQLLVNYFRVGMARRRDVLELISRMLGFSDSDLVAVGLKRVALTERIGSLLQPPELDGNSLPPLGTVSDKWIEYLMKETEEEEEDF